MNAVNVQKPCHVSYFFHDPRKISKKRPLVNLWSASNFRDIQFYPKDLSKRGVQFKRRIVLLENVTITFYEGVRIVQFVNAVVLIKSSFRQAFRLSIMSSILNKNVLFQFKVKFLYIQNKTFQFNIELNIEICASRT